MKSINIDLFSIFKNNTGMKIFFLLLSLISVPLFSENITSIKSALKDSTFKYFMDKDGDYIIEYKTSTGREQNIIIRGDTNAFQEIEVREILSIAATFENQPIPEKLNKFLLIDNYSLKYLGNWAIHKKNNTYTILFVVKLPISIELNYLEAAIIETGEAADALQKALEDEIDL